MRDEWYERSLIFFGFFVIFAFYYIFGDNVENNKFFKLGYNENLVFLHKKINNLKIYVEIIFYCFVIGFITSYWDNINYHIKSKRYKIKTKYLSLPIFIIASTFISRIFIMIMIYLTITSNVQFIVAFLLGNVAFQIPYSYYI